MKAVVFDGPGADNSRTHIADLPEPTPGPGQIAIAVEYAGINFKDIMQRRGDPGYVAAWPFVPGLEVLGRVLALGDGVTGYRVDDRVAAITGAGRLAEAVVVDARLVTAASHDLEKNLSAAAPAILTTAELLLGTLGRIRPGETVLLHSASGGVGQAVAALAHKYHVGRLIGTVGAASRAGAALSSGFHPVLTHDDGWVEAVRDVAPGGVDLVLDPSGTALLEHDLRVLAPGGRITVFGNASGAAPGPLPALPALMSHSAAIAGFSLAGLCAVAPDVVGDALNRVMQYIADADVRLDVTVLEGLEQVPEAHQYLATGQAPGKYIAKVRTA